MLHPLGVLGGTKHIDVTIRGTESLHTLVALLAVVEAWSHAMNAEVWVFYENGRGPFASLDGIVRFYMASDCAKVLIKDWTNNHGRY
jgi:hypothetical protein